MNRNSGAAVSITDEVEYERNKKHTPPQIDVLPMGEPDEREA